MHQPLATVRVVPLYQLCGRVAYLCVAFLPHIAKVCEKFVNFKWIFLYEPCKGADVYFQNQKYYLARSIGMCYNRGDVDFQSREVLVYVIVSK